MGLLFSSRMSARATLLLIALLFAPVALAVDPIPLPPGSSAFFPERAYDIVAADDGGVWAAVDGGIAHYTATSSSPVLPIPGGAWSIARAADGSIWFANETRIGRILTTGAIVEEYAIPYPYMRDIAVATDGALWYVGSSVVGRIAGGKTAEFVVTNAWSIAAASDGDVWVAEHGFGKSPDSVTRITPNGEMTPYPTGGDFLFGKLQTVRDGTLYAGTGITKSLLRLPSGSTNFQAVPHFDDTRFLADDAHNIWASSYIMLNYLGADGTTRFSIELPSDERQACDRDTWYYVPLAIDSDGGLWLKAEIDGAGFPFPMPCTEPAPVIARLIRLDVDTLLAAHGPHEIPTLSTTMLIGLAAMAIAIGVLRLRA